MGNEQCRELQHDLRSRSGQSYSVVKPGIFIIGHYNLVLRITYVVCFNFIHKWRDLQFKVDSERLIFEKLFLAILFTFRIFARNLLRGSRQRNILTFSFWCLTWVIYDDLNSLVLDSTVISCFFSLSFKMDWKYFFLGLKTSASLPRSVLAPSLCHKMVQFLKEHASSRLYIAKHFPISYNLLVRAREQLQSVT